MGSISLLLALYSLAFVSFTEALTAPQNLRCHVVNDTVEVSWEHSQSDEPFSGYYITVQKVGSGKESNPVFVHVKSGTRKAQIRGLQPGTVYQFKVAVYLDNSHEASAPVTVNTDSLAFLLAHDLRVSGITNTSAIFQWNHAAKNNVHHITFKLLCLGIQTFTRSGELMEERSSFEHESWSTSRGSESYTATSLIPNSHYTCHMLSVAGDKQSSTKLAPQVTFHTAPGKPSHPPRPRLSVKTVGKQKHNISFSAELYPSDNQFGPIGQYRVIAVPVSKDADQPRSMPYKPVVPLSQLMSHALSKKLATQVTEHVPFIVGDYTAEGLPHSLTFRGKWVRQAFKSDTYYSMVVAAFAKKERDAEPLYSLSPLADPPIHIGHDLQHDWMMREKPVATRFANTVLTAMLSVLGIFTLAFLVVFGSMYYKGNKRDAYYFSVNEQDSSSDEETVFIKKSPAPEELKTIQEKSSLLKSPDPVPPRSEGQSKAEWAIKNMYYNPAFEEMVYRGPDTMREMENTMTMIADKKAGQSQERTELAAEGQLAETNNTVCSESSATPSKSQQTEPVVSQSATANEETSLPPPPPPPPLPPSLPPPSQSQAPSPTLEDAPTENTSAATYQYSSLTCKPGAQNLCPSPGGRKAHPHSPSSLPPYYYVTLNPAPGVSLEEYNITVTASPLTTVHRITPSATPTKQVNSKLSPAKTGTVVFTLESMEKEQ